MKKICTIILLITLSSNLLAEDNLILNVPDNWRKEVFAFPLEFAPEIKLSGTEEVHFAPGMFKPKASDYFNYIFLWHIKEKQAFTPSDYSTFLNQYYRGLYLAVSNTDKKQNKANQFTYKFLERQKDKILFQGDWLDPFNKNNPVELLIAIEANYCPAKDITNILFRITSTDHNSAITELNAMKMPQC
ncbi:hypothetical protein [Kordiimonas sp. SCSIO 12610]|uniref:hypothetical protein n=1 Tax=Kordiimonas sp. SCSIO 12610 TaxID=2829597 RepID=UPI00210ACDE6|nr:hypothetical protein [Kordiimonas sp. SCSIO 12610]UTW54964.1 hypothetical protein KFF44_14320 [Kordiimonas sp. SCSIO 12610]